MVYSLLLDRIQQRPGVAQFGRALDWGSRGREFKSRHSDHVAASPCGLPRFALPVAVSEGSPFGLSGNFIHGRAL